MTRTVEDLRAALDGVADQVDVPDTDRTVDAVARRLDRGRRIRTGVIAAATVVVLALATLVGFDTLGQNQSAPTPAQLKPTPAELNRTHHTHFPAYALGYRLANIVEVPLARSADHTSPVHLRIPASSLGAPLLLPLGTPRDSGVADTTPNTILTVTGGRLTSPMSEPVYTPKGPMFTPKSKAPWPHGLLSTAIPVRPGEKFTLTGTTTLSHPRAQMPVAVYAPAAWDKYPLGKAPFTGVPKMPPPARSGSHEPGANTVLGRLVVHSKAKPTATVTATITWPKGANMLDLTPLPTTTGRLRVRFDGTPLNCARPPFRDRTTWCEFFDSDLSWPRSGGPADVPRTPAAGTRHTITVEAQDVTGPWRVVLEPEKRATK